MIDGVVGSAAGLAVEGDDNGKTAVGVVIAPEDAGSDDCVLPIPVGVGVIAGVDVSRLDDSVVLAAMLLVPKVVGRCVGKDDGTVGFGVVCVVSTDVLAFVAGIVVVITCDVAVLVFCGFFVLVVVVKAVVVVGVTVVVVVVTVHK